MYTLSILKPDAVRRNITGRINTYFELSGLQIAAQKMLKLTRYQAENFYIHHQDKVFFVKLIDFMISGPIIVQVIKGTYDVVDVVRKIIGHTDPKLADVGSIRRDLADSIDANVVHGSDSVDNAKLEIDFFFTASEILR